MQSYNIQPKTPTQPQEIVDLLAMLKTSGWQMDTEKIFYMTMHLGERNLILTQTANDFTLVCKDVDPNGSTLTLPLILKINPFPIVNILLAYGIITMMAVAEVHSVGVYDLLGVEAIAS